VWRSTVADFELAEYEYAILEQALVQLDRATACRRLIDAEGLLLPGLHGMRVNGLLAVERAAGAAGARLLRQLGVGAESTGTGTRLELWGDHHGA
jgi:hypothetical protein